MIAVRLRRRGFTMRFTSITRLQLRSRRFVPPFALHTWWSMRQVRDSVGFCSGAILADCDLTFWTMTLWRDEADMRRYMSAGAHRQGHAEACAVVRPGERRPLDRRRGAGLGRGGAAHAKGGPSVEGPASEPKARRTRLRPDRYGPRRAGAPARAGGSSRHGLIRSSIGPGSPARGRPARSRTGCPQTVQDPPAPAPNCNIRRTRPRRRRVRPFRSGPTPAIVARCSPAPIPPRLRGFPGSCAT